MINEDGCNNLRFEFRYSAVDNTIELHYLFVSGVPTEDRRTVDMNPVARTLTMERADRVFDSHEKAQQATQNAERLFTEGLGWAIDRAMQLLFHEVLYRSGIHFKKRGGPMIKILSSAFEQDLRQQIEVKSGRLPTWKSDEHYRAAMWEIRAELTAAKRPITQSNCASLLAAKTGAHVIDERLIRKWNEDHDLKWRAYKSGTN